MTETMNSAAQMIEKAIQHGIPREIAEQLPPSMRVQAQTRKYGPKLYREGRNEFRIIVTARYDDSCNNGVNSFGLTAAIDRKTARGLWTDYSGGCCHDVIVEHFPELEPLVKWHLTDSICPMHYLANVVYMAGDRDCDGLRKGEKRQLRNGKSGLPVWQRVVRNAAGNEVKVGHHDWADSAEAPVEVLTVAWEPVWIEGAGKARELDAARRGAVWPDAPDEILTAEPDVLRAALLSRLPALMREFKTAMEGLGFTY
jgi:hypothetical protein